MHTLLKHVHQFIAPLEVNCKSIECLVVFFLIQLFYTASDCLIQTFPYPEFFTKLASLEISFAKWLKHIKSLSDRKFSKVFPEVLIDCVEMLGII